MGHWFLAGRDLMWFCLMYTPVFCAYIIGEDIMRANTTGEGNIHFPFTAILAVGAFFIQPMLFLCVYEGWIK